MFHINFHYCYYFTPWDFLTSELTDSLSLEFEWQQVSKTLLCILADLNNAVIWIVSTRPLISKSCSPFTNPLVTVPRAPITIGITVTLMFHSFFNFLARSKYLFFSISFSFTLWSAETEKATIRQVLFFLLNLIKSCRLAKIRWSVCVSKSHTNLCLSFPSIYSGLCIYHLFLWTNSNFLPCSQGITFPTQSCLVLYSLCARLLCSLGMRLIHSSLSLHNLHLLFCCILPILALIRLVFIIIIIIASLFTSVLVDGFSLESDWKQIFSSIQFSSYYTCLAYHVWMVSARLTIWNSPDINKSFSITQRSPFIIGITITLFFHSFLVFWQGLSTCLPFRFTLIFSLWSTGTAKSTIRLVSQFLLSISRSCLLTKIRWSFSSLESQKILCFILQDGFCIWACTIWSYVKISTPCTTPCISPSQNQTCLVLYYLCSSILHFLFRD